jgi:DNA-binding FadR family transcriptional regulator
MRRADMDFHALLYEMSGNALIADAMNLQWWRLAQTMAQVLKAPGVSENVWNEHEAIFEFMIEGNGEAAANLMVQHLANAYERLNEGVRSFSEIGSA